VKFNQLMESELVARKESDLKTSKYVEEKVNSFKAELHRVMRNRVDAVENLN
jgi:hypothetical protein